MILVLQSMTDVEAQEHFDEFFEEVFVELQDKVMTKWSTAEYVLRLYQKPTFIEFV